MLTMIIPVCHYDKMGLSGFCFLISIFLKFSTNERKISYVKASKYGNIIADP